MVRCERSVLLICSCLSIVSAYAQGIKPVAGSKKEDSPLGYSTSGGRHISTRQMLADISFPPGVSPSVGRGRVSIIFDPSSGYYINFLEWHRDKYPKQSPWIEDIVAGRTRVWVTPTHLLMVFAGGGTISVWESTDKASSVDDAEDRSLRWHSERLSQVAARGYQPQWTAVSFRVGKSEIPKGYLRSDFYSSPGLPLKLSDMKMVNLLTGEERFEIIMETDMHRRIAVPLIRREGKWYTGLVEPAK